MAPSYDRSDAELLVASASDPEVFVHFYKRYEKVVLAYFIRRVQDPELAADLAAETFAMALAGARRFSDDGRPAAAWRFAIAARRLSSFRRRQRVETRARRRLGIGPLALTDERLEAIEQLRDPRALGALEELPADQRAAVLARVVEDRGYPEIAAALETTEGAVRQRVWRGLRGIRDRLEEAN